MSELTGRVWDLIVVGGGPGGYVAAIRAGQLGLAVVCVEQRPLPGGTCLHEGCIPSKALLHSSWLYHQARHDFGVHGIQCQGLGLNLAALQERKGGVVEQLARGVEQLFRKYRVTRVQGVASVREAGQVWVRHDDGRATTLQGRRILLATGGEAVALPHLPVDGQRILEARHALALESVPDHLVVVGGGAIGLELGSVWLRLGSRVTVVEALPEILPGVDETLVRQGKRLWRQQGFTFLTGTALTGAGPGPGGLQLALRGSGGESQSLAASHLLVAVGRRPCLQGVELPLARDGQGRVVVDDAYQTSVPGVFAVGDLIPGPMLAHKAMAEGARCVEGMAGVEGHAPLAPIPAVVYTHPELASVGRSEAGAKREGIAVRVGLFPFMANGRARASGEGEGMVKVVAEAATGRLLGVHILGPQAGELIAAAATALQAGCDAAAWTRTVMPHPSLAESLHEAALAAAGLGTLHA